MVISVTVIDLLNYRCMNWITFTLLAATMQAVRTAGQKKLAEQLSAIATTSARYWFAWPLAIVYLLALLNYFQVAMPTLPGLFFLYTSIAALSQIFGTAALVKAFSYRNFSVATSLSKTEAILVAVLGTFLFAVSLTWELWLSVLVGVIGVVLVSKVKLRWRDLFTDLGSFWGLASAAGLAVTTLLIREASLTLPTVPLISAAITLVVMISMQSLLTLVYLFLTDKNQFTLMKQNQRLCWFVGVTSLLGSIGWFTAASLQLAALVKALGQVEFFISLFITLRVFKEKVSIKELVGMALILVSVILLLLTT